MRSTSTSPAVLQLMQGPARSGVTLGHGHILFDDYVVSVTARGGSRMPNGIEAELWAPAGAGAVIGDGCLTVDKTTILPGPEWNPRPTPRVALSLQPDFVPDSQELCGWGPGLTPLGDDILVGFLAATALYGGAVAPRNWPTTPLSQTLLRHAAQGELTSATHRLLAYGDASALVRFGATSGRGILLGLASGCVAARGRGGSEESGRPAHASWTVDVPLPTGRRGFHIRVTPLSPGQGRWPLPGRVGRHEKA